MKKLIIILSLLCIMHLSVLGDGFNFSTTVRDANGSFLINRNVQLKLSIITDSKENSTATFIEQFNTATNSYGVANVVVGNGNAISGDFSAIDWTKKLFLKTEVAINNDNNYSETSITEIGAVPYSMHSNTANALVMKSPNGTAWNISVDDSGNMTSTPINDIAYSPEYGNADYIFDDKALPVITIELSTAEWNNLLTNFDKNSNNEDCVHADFYFNKYGTIHKIEDIGIRLRGNTSRIRPEGNSGELHNPDNPAWHHCHFAFRFAKFNSDNLFSGTDRFSLRFAKEDPTYVHEIYSYDLLRRFGVWTTPKSSYCRLRIKIKEDNATAYMGVYEMFEGIDDQYLDDRCSEGKIKEASGFLWKMGWANGVAAFLTADHATGSNMGISDNPTEGSSVNFTYDYKSKKKKFDTAKAQFCQFITDLNSKTGSDFVTWTEQNINIELLLRAYAVTTAVGQWDDYWCNGNNYYLYFDTDGKCNYVPYDFDNALGTSNDGLMYNPGTGNPLSWGNANRPLITKVLAVDMWKAQYLNYLRELVSPDNDYLDADKSIARIKAWQNRISNFVDNDSGTECVIEDKTASWSSGIKNYRLLTGDENAGNSSSDPNFFRSRIKYLNSILR